VTIDTWNVNEMRILFPTLLLLAACATASTNDVASLAPVEGAPSARAAVDMFMNGMKASDLEEVGNVWGTRDWLVRDHYPRDEFEKRVMIASCYIAWDGYQITAEHPNGSAAAVTVRSTAPGNAQQTVVQTEENSSGRWVVKSFEIGGLKPARCM
jgi:hypothetical protein